jgi:hypothetical protein
MTLASGGVVLAALLAIACSEAGAPLALMDTERAARLQETPVSGSAQAAAIDQKLIRSGELQVQVGNVEEAVRRADSIVQTNGGLVTDGRNIADDNNRQRAHLTLRVPADRFRSTMDALKTLGVVKSDASAQQDITKAYFDVQTRLSVKEQALGRLRRLLADRTGGLSDVLEVEREITRVVAEIEQMKGERRYYDNQVALATITVTLFEPGALRAASTMSIGSAFGQSLAVLNTSMGWLVYLLTFVAPWIALASLVWWLVRAVRRRRAA